ncbi:Uncharacterized protein SCG7086_AA_00590 [Chlamydiales bacterium SCGC AG-110-P3]|nr:Uncharacterized protein SCG7086_AA_00590 [Chlamydiales bacterium SCGC AG-110-P3]
MKLQAIEGNTQRLDGGSMFGNAPKALWSRWLTPDDSNRIALACRSLHLETDDGQQILFDVGIGAFFEPKLKDRFGVVEEEHVLLKNLEAAGTSHEEIDIIVLSHLHFDHAGGLLSAYDGSDPQLLFPNAKILIGKAHWERAQNPHMRERASFLPRLHTLLKESGRLTIVEGQTHSELPNDISLTYVDGHSIGSMLSQIETPSGPVVFVADLIPGMPWMHLPITMGYDRFPELLVDEKRTMLDKLLKTNGRVFFAHDPEISCAAVRQDERGRFFGEPVSL